MKKARLYKRAFMNAFKCFTTKTCTPDINLRATTNILIEKFDKLSECIEPC